jgi:uracil-DNA glycosylase
MRKFVFDYNSLKTRSRLKNLEKYFKSNILMDNKFICSSYKECKKSHSGLFYKGQLHHVGKKYDLAINKVPIRIMVVGQEWGHEDNLLTFKQNYNSKIECGKTNFNDRNPHMKGTTSVLRLLFNIGLGIKNESEKIYFDNGEKCHIFDAFSLVNFLICSALIEGKGMAGHSSTIMKQNCQEHFKNTMDILDPNIIIVQGKGFWKWVYNSFNDIKLLPKSDVLYETKINGNPVIIASFTHPSARRYIYNWGLNDHTDYLIKIVKPNVKRIQNYLGL